MSSLRPLCRTKWTELINVDPARCPKAFALLSKLESDLIDTFDEYILVRTLYVPPTRSGRGGVFKWFVSSPQKGHAEHTDKTYELEDVCRMLGTLLFIAQIDYTDQRLDIVKKAGSLIVYLRRHHAKYMRTISVTQLFEDAVRGIKRAAAYLVAIDPETPVTLAYPLLQYASREYQFSHASLIDLKAALLLHEGKRAVPMDYNKMLCASCVSRHPMYAQIVKEVPQIPRKTIDHRCVIPDTRIDVDEWFDEVFLQSCAVFMWNVYRLPNMEVIERDLREAMVG